YRAEPAGGKSADVTLVLYQRGGTQATQVGRNVTIPNLVAFNMLKLILVIGGSAVALLALGLWLTRAHGRITVIIDRAVDIAEEVLCVEIAQTELRPQLPEDLAASAAATKKAGSTTKQRSATLIASA